MCSRFALKSKIKTVAGHFKVQETLRWEPRYNIAPSQHIPAIVHPLDQEKREMKSLQWGFVASWAQGGRLLVNVQSEHLNNKPLFEESFEKWRCLIPVDGFYEWRHRGQESKPFFVRMKSREPFALAGLWAPQPHHGQSTDACAILTTVPNEMMGTIHHRMPVIIDPSDYGLWLDSQDVREFAKVQKLFNPFPSQKMEAYEVDGKVNSSFYDDPSCLEQAQSPETLSLPFG